MKRIYYLFGALFAATPLFAQDFSLVYEPSTESDYVAIRDVYTTSDDNLIIGFDVMAGGTVPSAGIMKTDKDGLIDWSKVLEIPESVAGCTFEVAESAEGTYYLWGLSKEVETDHMRAILSEISAEGEMLWSKEYDFGTNLTASYTVNKLQVMPSGDLQMMIAVFDRVIVLKTDAEGEIIWGKATAMVPDMGGKNPGFEWMAIPDDGGMCASKAENDFSLLRYDDEGELVWTKTYSVGGYTHGKSIARSPNGNILVAGFVDFVPHIMEISDEDGELLWVKRFEDKHMAFISAAHLNVDGEDILLDFTTSADEQYIVKLNADGEVVNSMVSAFPVLDYNKLELTENDGDYFYGAVNVDGGYNGVIHRVQNLFEESCMLNEVEPLVLTDFETFEEVDFTPYESEYDVQENIDVTLSDYQLRAKYFCEVVLSIEEDTNYDVTVFPNPANDNMTVLVPEALVNSTYRLVDLSGKVVLQNTIANMQTQIDLSELNQGQYILTVQNADQIITEKVTLIK